MRLVVSKEGNPESSSAVYLYLMIDETDGIIADGKFQAYGPPALIGFAEVLLELILHKNYDQASRVSGDLIDRHVREKKDEASFPNEAFSYVNMILLALDQAVEKCKDIPLSSSSIQTPIYEDLEEGKIEGFETFTKEEKLAIIEKVIEKKVRPYIELDAGGITLVDFQKDFELIISYEGACTSCYAATGSTLSAIQNILRTNVHPELIVIPKM